MALKLPKPATLNPSLAYSVGQTLTNVVAWRPAAQTTYQFYEEVDAWLGPWGQAGYPIGYGKKYNIAFTTNPILNSPFYPVAHRWVRQTTINLQLALVDVIVAAIRDNTLYKILQEDQIRAAAFDSHPGAYLRAGLQQVAEQEPECVPVIMMIPWEQFNPLNPSFAATFRQIVQVIRQPGVKSWVSTALKGAANLPREDVRVHYEEARVVGGMVREEVDRQVDSARRLVLSQAKRALLRHFAEMTERYAPLRRYFY